MYFHFGHKNCWGSLIIIIVITNYFVSVLPLVKIAFHFKKGPNSFIETFTFELQYETTKPILQQIGDNLQSRAAIRMELVMILAY